MNMNNNGAHSGLPTPFASSTGNAPFVPNGTFVSSIQQAPTQFRGAGGQPPLSLQRVPQPVLNQQPQPQPQPQPPHHPQAYPLPAPTTSGPSLDALNSMAKEHAGFDIRPPGMPAQTWNTGFPAQPPIPQVPRGPYQWPAYGYNLPVQNHYGGYPGPQVQGVAPHVAPFAAPYHGAQMHAPPQAASAVQVPHLQQQQVLPNVVPPPPATQEHVPRIPGYANLQVPSLNQGVQQVLPNVVPPPPATQEHVPRIPGYVNLQVPSLNQGVQQAPPVQWHPPAPFAEPQLQLQQAQQAMPQVPSVGPVEGSSTRGSKRKAVDNDNTTQSRQKRHRPQDDPDFELAPLGEDGKPRWKCLKNACAHVRPMLENSVHKHVTATVSHQKDSEQSLPVNVCSGCGVSFKRPDALKRHGPTDQCTRNKAKALHGAQASSQALGNSTFAVGPSSSGSASSSVTEKSLFLPVATPGVVQTAGNSTLGAAAPVAMPQRQFSFEAPVPSTMTWRFGVQATRTKPVSTIQHAPSLPVLPQIIPSLPQVQAPVTMTSVQQQPAVTLPLQAVQGHSSTSDQTSTPLPSTSMQSTRNALPIMAGDFTLSIFKKTAAPSSSSPPEDVNDSSDGLFSSPSSPSPPEDVNDSSDGLFSSPSSPTPPEDVKDSSDGLFSSPSSPTPPEDVNDSSDGLFSSPSSPSPPEDVNDSSTSIFSAPSSPSDDALYSLYLFSAPPSPS